MATRTVRMTVSANQAGSRIGAIGLWENASVTRPCNIASQARVVPQSGQGIPKRFLRGQIESGACGRLLTR